MNRKQLKALISAGVFSTALLSGTAYAEKPAKDVAKTDSTADTQVIDSSTTPKDQAEKSAAPAAKSKKSSSDKKEAGAQSGCSGAGGCGGHS